MYTVKQLSNLAGVTVRTLHYYDEVGLLKPSSVGQNGYRSYSDADLYRLQQILFYREMGLELTLIKEIIHNPNFDQAAALRSHRKALEDRIDRLKILIETIDSTIASLNGGTTMSGKEIFSGFSREQQKRYAQEAKKMWGESVDQSNRRWESYSEEKKQAIMQEGKDIYRDIVAVMDKGAESAEVQVVLVRWHEHLRYFYEPSPERLRGLGELYFDHPEFNANFAAIHPDLPAFLKEAIAYYVDHLKGQG